MKIGRMPSGIAFCYMHRAKASLVFIAKATQRVQRMLQEKAHPMLTHASAGRNDATEEKSDEKRRATPAAQLVDTINKLSPKTKVFEELEVTSEEKERPFRRTSSSYFFGRLAGGVRVPHARRKRGFTLHAVAA
jgi:hypothetical protein